MGQKSWSRHTWWKQPWMSVKFNMTSKGKISWESGLDLCSSGHEQGVGYSNAIMSGRVLKEVRDLLTSWTIISFSVTRLHRNMRRWLLGSKNYRHQSITQIIGTRYILIQNKVGKFSLLQTNIIRSQSIKDILIKKLPHLSNRVYHVW